MSLSLDSRQLFVAPLAGVKRQGRGTLGGGGAAVGYRIPFRSAPPLSSEPIPFPSYAPSSIRGKALEREVLFLVEKGGSRAGSPSFSRVLQPLVYGNEGLGVVETRHRPFHSEPSRPQVSVQDGDSSVCSPLGDAWGLDGFVGSPGRLLAGSSSFRQPQVPAVRGLEPGFSVQCPLFRSLHSPPGFHESHSSGISFSPPSRGQDTPVSQRLACPGPLSDSGPSCSGLCPPVMSGVGQCGEQGQVEPRPFPTDRLPRHAPGFCLSGLLPPSQKSRSYCQFEKNFCPPLLSQCHLGGFFLGFCLL